MSSTYEYQSQVPTRCEFVLAAWNRAGSVLHAYRRNEETLFRAPIGPKSRKHTVEGWGYSPQYRLASKFQEVQGELHSRAAAWLVPGERPPSSPTVKSVRAYEVLQRPRAVATREASGLKGARPGTRDFQPSLGTPFLNHPVLTTHPCSQADGGMHEELAHVPESTWQARHR